MVSLQILVFSYTRKLDSSKEDLRRKICEGGAWSCMWIEVVFLVNVEVEVEVVLCRGVWQWRVEYRVRGCRKTRGGFLVDC